MPEEVPDDLIDLFDKGSYERCRAYTGNSPTVSENEYFRGGLALALTAHEAMVRAKVTAEMRRAAEGRHAYAQSYPEGHADRETLLTQAETFGSAAKIAEGDKHVMLGLLPVRMWTDDEEAIALGEGL